MIKEFTLTDFVDVIMKSGTPKATKVNQVKNRPEYNPATDYYKKIRDLIIQIHKDDLDIEELDKVIPIISENKKINYRIMIDGYKTWIRRKNIMWFSPPIETYVYRDVGIKIRPELGLIINDKPHIIKLYFKGEALAKNRAEIITCLMKENLEEKATEGSIIGILDVRKGKFLTCTGTSKNLPAMINAEMSYISSLWDEL